MQVHCRTVPAVVICVGKFLTHCIADFLSNLLAPGLSHQNLGGELGAGGTGHVVAQAGRAIALGSCDLADGLYGSGGITAHVDQCDHIIDGQLIQQLIPIFVVIGLACQIGQRQTVVCSGGRHYIIGIVIIGGVVLQNRDFLDGGLIVLAQLKLGLAGCGSCCIVVGETILTGQNLMVAFHVGEQVLCCHTVGGTAVNAVIDVSVQGEGLAVQHSVRVGADGHNIFACFQHIAAVFGLVAGRVIGGHILQFDGEADGLGLTGLQQLGLGEVDQIDGGLLNAAVGVGRRVVQLHNILTSHIAGVGDGDFQGDHLITLLEGGDLLGEGGVAQAVAEGILNFSVVVDDAVIGRSFVILVTGVDTLHIVGEGQNALVCAVLTTQHSLQVADICV